MDIFEILGKRSKSLKLQKRLYAALAPSKKTPSSVAQDLYTSEGGNVAAEYLYGKLMGCKEGHDYQVVEIQSVEDFVICSHLMKSAGFAGRMDELLDLGPTWEVVGNRWHQIAAIASLENGWGPFQEEMVEPDEDDMDGDSQGLTQSSIDALLLTLEPPVGGHTIARFVREQHSQYSGDGWVVRELTDRIVTEAQMEEADMFTPIPVRLPSDCMGVVMCKFGVHPEFLIVKATGAE